MVGGWTLIGKHGGDYVYSQGSTLGGNYGISATKGGPITRLDYNPLSGGTNVPNKQPWIGASNNDDESDVFEE